MTVAQKSSANSSARPDPVQPAVPVALADERSAPAPSAALIYQDMLQARLRPVEPRYSPLVRLAIIVGLGVGTWTAVILVAKLVSTLLGST